MSISMIERERRAISVHADIRNVIAEHVADGADPSVILAGATCALADILAGAVEMGFSDRRTVLKCAAEQLRVQFDTDTPIPLVKSNA